MQRVLADQVIRRALRARICPTCPHRPEGSESLGPLVARSCEGTCTIFVNLEALKKIARDCRGDPLASFERIIQEGICQHCVASPSAGDYCIERFNRTCPLSVYAGQVLSIIESLLPRQAVGR